MSFRPDEMRDFHGRWTLGGSGGHHTPNAHIGRPVTEGPHGPLKAVNMRGVGWRNEKNQVVGFTSPGFGVKRADGKYLASNDGFTPVSYDRKRTADEVANTIIENGQHKWIDSVPLTGGKPRKDTRTPAVQPERKFFNIDAANQSITPMAKGDEPASKAKPARSVADKILDALAYEDELKRNGEHPKQQAALDIIKYSTPERPRIIPDINRAVRDRHNGTLGPFADHQDIGNTLRDLEKRGFIKSKYDRDRRTWGYYLSR